MKLENSRIKMLQLKLDDRVFHFCYFKYYKI